MFEAEIGNDALLVVASLVVVRLGFEIIGLAIGAVIIIALFAMDLFAYLRKTLPTRIREARAAAMGRTPAMLGSRRTHVVMDILIAISVIYLISAGWKASWF